MIEKKVIVLVGVVILVVWLVYHFVVVERERTVFVIITVEKVEDIPQEEIIELTEEEVSVYPILKCILEEIENTGKNRIDYKTTESKSMEIMDYIENKYRSKYNSLAGYPHFKYREKIYIMVVMVP
ncbi:MAG: hypothetical protein DRG59_08795 [Deltaproteobacteria bacterium]|nr:MAG: hypothetical protein DRG59_08795 [Deltaproteobacteria bacterium]